MKDRSGQRFPWQIMLSEVIGTALLCAVGLSVVILMFGTGSRLAEEMPDIFLRRLITGFLFGTTGALIAISGVGKISGAHINPVVTLAFWLFRKLDLRTVVAYVTGQLVGATLGSLPLLIWGSMGRSVAFGATLPGEAYTTEIVLLGEIITTFTMVSLLTIFIGFRRLRPFTPAIFPFLYAVMVATEAAISGTSTNPARSLGPSIISGQWQGWWIYWVGPVIGTLASALACSLLAKRIDVAKLYHFDSNRDLLFRRVERADSFSA